MHCRTASWNNVWLGRPLLLYNCTSNYLLRRFCRSIRELIDHAEFWSRKKLKTDPPPKKNRPEWKDKGNFKKNGFFYIFPSLIRTKKFQEQLIILKGDYDGHFFAQGYFGSQSLHRKKSFNFLCRNGQECNTFFHNENWKSIFTKLAY